MQIYFQAQAQALWTAFIYKFYTVVCIYFYKIPAKILLRVLPPTRRHFRPHNRCLKYVYTDFGMACFPFL